METKKKQFAYENKTIFNRKFIPSQIINTQDSESVIIEFDGVTLQAIRGKKKDDPLLVYKNGERISSVKAKEKLTFEFPGMTGGHTINLWNARAKGFFFTSFFLICYRF